MTAIDTNTNAVIVPIFTKLANKFKSTNPANKVASIPVTHVLKMEFVNVYGHLKVFW